MFSWNSENKPSLGSIASVILVLLINSILFITPSAMRRHRKQSDSIHNDESSHRGLSNLDSCFAAECAAWSRSSRDVIILSEICEIE